MTCIDRRYSVCTVSIGTVVQQRRFKIHQRERETYSTRYGHSLSMTVQYDVYDNSIMSSWTLYAVYVVRLYVSHCIYLKKSVNLFIFSENFGLEDSIRYHSQSSTVHCVSHSM